VRSVALLLLDHDGHILGREPDHVEVLVGSAPAHPWCGRHSVNVDLFDSTYAVSTSVIAGCSGRPLSDRLVEYSSP
jgi:hypothetical protein